MTELKQRKKKSNLPQKPSSSKSNRKSTASKDQLSKHENDVLVNFMKNISTLVGLVVMFIMAYKYAGYLEQLHENQMWFTNIKEVEREISFRTESGLYYSYYKQLVNAPTVSKGLYELTHDNITEHPKMMNVLERMNIYQEVVLAVIYRTFPFIKNTYKPIFFYIKSVFALNGMLLGALYMIAWMISGTWLSGVLAATFYVFNKDDTTRVAYVIPLRESFSLPFLWAQLVFITYYFKPNISKSKERLCVLGVWLCTLLFSIQWQFNQFILILQAMALFGVQVLRYVPHYKIRHVYIAQFGCMLLVAVSQFFNTMILTGLLMSFVPAALIIMYIQGDRPTPGNIFMKIVKIVLYIILVFVLMAVISKIFKVLVAVDSDEHIYKFVMVKFGLLDHSREFDVSLYICNGAFQFQELGFFERLTKRVVFPVYCIVHVGLLLVLAADFWVKHRAECQLASKKKDDDISPDGDSSEANEAGEEETITRPINRPALFYHTIQTVFFGILALTTLRMKYLWSPYMCILPSSVIADYQLWNFILHQLGNRSVKVVNAMRNLVVIFVLSITIALCFKPMMEELKIEREFYDPDTVQLMEWINEHTAPKESFSGSMQLLAGVKLCTDRPITNHPHFEDKHLREKTLELYQYYGRKDPEEVYSVLKKYKTDYIIMEDSICFQANANKCGLPDQLDLHDGIQPEKASPIKGLKTNNTPRFCLEVRHQRNKYKKYFKPVFSNKTFKIYRVL